MPIRTNASASGPSQDCEPSAPYHSQQTVPSDADLLASARQEALRLRELLALETSVREALEQKWLTNVEHLRLFFDHTPAAVAMVDTEMRYLAASQRWLDAYDLSGRKPGGHSHYELFPEAPERWKAIYQRVLESGVGESSEEDCFMRADGSIEWSRWKVHPWLNTHGEIGGLVLFEERITDRKSLEAQLQQAQKMETVGHMTGGLAHDFNNLLMIVSGSLELLREKLGDSGEASALVDDAWKAVQRGSELNRRLLSFSRDREIKPQIFNVGVAVTDLASLLRGTLDHGVQFDVTVSGGPWLCSLQRAAFDNAIINLVINARDAMSGGGRLSIAVRPDDPATDSVKIEVCDDGCGIPADLLNRVTEPFFSTKEEGRGSGLGLSMVRTFTEQHGGSFEVSSEVGTGTTIRMRLPRWAGKRKGATRATATTRHVAQTILVVDSQRRGRKDIVEMLTRLGYSAVLVQSCEDGLAALIAEPSIDVLLTEVRVLDEGDGLDLARQASQLQPGIGTLFMTAEPAQANQVPADVEVLLSPFGSNQLAEALASARAAGRAGISSEDASASRRARVQGSLSGSIEPEFDEASSQFQRLRAAPANERLIG